MKRTLAIKSLTVSLLLACSAVQADTASEAALSSTIERLQQELSRAQQALRVERQQNKIMQRQLTDAQEQLEQPSASKPVDEKITFAMGDGLLTVGGAIRANYAIGDYPATGGASKASEDGGNFNLDQFKVALSYENGPVAAEMDYRFIDGYNFLHTAWLGYTYADNSQVQVGINRVPFGPGPWGVSQSWFFDQHYYVGLADDMDLGVKYSKPAGDWRWDFAYYLRDEGHYNGSSNDSARHSYDIVNESGSGYEERNQVNLRGIYTLSEEDKSTELGFSVEYGELESQGSQKDGDHSALSLHMVNRWQGFTLATQLSYYDNDVDAAQPLGTDKLVQTGAFDFPNTFAAKAWLPAISLSYRLDTPTIAWLDYLLPYVEYSSLMKHEESFNDSELITLGTAWASGGWYIYTEVAMSNGSEYVGGDTSFGDRLGANVDDAWQTRFNANFGYYY